MGAETGLEIKMFAIQGYIREIHFEFNYKRELIFSNIREWINPGYSRATPRVWKMPLKNGNTFRSSKESGLKRKKWITVPIVTKTSRRQLQLGFCPVTSTVKWSLDLCGFSRDRRALTETNESTISHVSYPMHKCLGQSCAPFPIHMLKP